jgi:hypothetical protein
MDQASGTSMNPFSWPMPMLIESLGSWHAMFMANAFIVDTQQSAPPRARQVLFSQLVHGVSPA